MTKVSIEIAANLEAALRMYMQCCGNTAAIVDRQSVREAWEAGEAALRAYRESIEESGDAA